MLIDYEFDVNSSSTRRWNDVCKLRDYRNIINKRFNNLRISKSPFARYVLKVIYIRFISQECIVVCVVSLEETNITPANVPYNQCKEVRTENSPTSNMDKITIAASAAICATIVVAVIIFIVANRRRARKLHTLHSIDQTKMGGPITGLPVNCCSNVGPTPSPGGPLSSMATLSAYNAQKEWDQVSAYSNRSIPRPRIFPVDRQGIREQKKGKRKVSRV